MKQLREFAGKGILLSEPVAAKEGEQENQDFIPCYETIKAVLKGI